MVWPSIEQYMKRNYLHFLERWFGKNVLLPEEMNRSGLRSILVVRQHDQLGDFLLATPALRALREYFPSARIGLLVRKYFSDVARCVPFVDEVIMFHEGGARWIPKNIISLFRQLRGGWDLTIVLNTVSHSLTSDMLAYFSDSAFVLGSGGKVFPGCSRNFFYNLISSPPAAAIHQSEENLNIVRYIGAGTNDLSEVIKVPESEIRTVRTELLKMGLLEDKLVIGIHPGAGKHGNRWPVGYFSKVATMLHEKHQAQILLFWGPAEQELCDQFCRMIKFEPLKISPTGLVTLAAYFTCCDALLCNDTGVMHLAAASGIPVLALFGTTDPGEWKPYGADCIGLRGENGNIENINPEKVFDELQQLAGRKNYR